MRKALIVALSALALTACGTAPELASRATAHYEAGQVDKEKTLTELARLADAMLAADYNELCGKRYSLRAYQKLFDTQAKWDALVTFCQWKSQEPDTFFE